MNFTQLLSKTRSGVWTAACALLLLCTGEKLWAQTPVTVTGTVVSEKEEPLLGVTVLAKAVNSSETADAVTDEKGMFTFKTLKAGSVYNLSFSFVGYEPYAMNE